MLSVVVFHATAHNPSVGMSSSLAALTLARGSHGVDLFFILSGFCLSYPTLARLRRDGIVTFDLARFTAHRLVRILPPYWAAMIALFAFAAVLTHPGAFHLPWHPFALPESMHERNVLDVVRQAIFIDRGLEYFNASFWSLAIEFHWYIIFPIALWLWIRFPRLFVITMAAAVIASELMLPNNLDDMHYLPGFMLGIIAADLRARERSHGARALAAGALCLLIALGASHEVWKGGTNIFWQLIAFCTFVAASDLPIFQRLLSFRPLAAIGVASYSIYLVHEPLIDFLEHTTWLGRSPAGQIVASAVIAVVSGSLFFLIAERPFVTGRLRSWLIASLEARLSPFCAYLAMRAYLVKAPAPVCGGASDA